ncbi:MAG: sugar nucleotide-binding protein [Pseudomonadota bacterium]
MTDAVLVKPCDVLILGAGGLLGGAFTTAYRNGAVSTAGRGTLTGATQTDLYALISACSPALVINCAADVDAEGAERDDTIALAANVELPANLARACHDAGVGLVQFSSTGCYGAWKETPYNDDDPLSPTTRHHRSKAMGEDAVRAAGGEHLIVRTGWLFGGAPGRPRNFVWQRMIEADRSARLVCDGVQRGCPTNVEDVASQVIKAWSAGVRGTVNAVARGVATRADYVSRIVEAAQIDCRVESGPAFQRLAPVSPNETASNARLEALGVANMPDWRDGIDRYVGALVNSSEWKLRRA